MELVLLPLVVMVVLVVVHYSGDRGEVHACAPGGTGHLGGVHGEGDELEPLAGRVRVGAQHVVLVLVVRHLRRNTLLNLKLHPSLGPRLLYYQKVFVEC